MFTLIKFQNRNTQMVIWTILVVSNKNIRANVDAISKNITDK